MTDRDLPEGLSPEHTRTGDDGDLLVNRDGLAELTGYKVRTLKLKAVEDEGRFPPVAQIGPGKGRPQWYRLADALTYAAAVDADREAARPGLNPNLSAAQQRELLDAEGYLTPEALAVLLDREVDTIYSYITRSRAKWDAGEPGILAVPDRREARGTAYERLGWRLETAIAHQEHERTGSIKGGRPPAAPQGS